MAEDMNGLLLEDRWAPITSEMGFLEAKAEHVARTFTAWLAGLQTSQGLTIEARSVSGSLEQTLSTLLPITSPGTQRELFIPTRNSWTAYVENGWGGTDAASCMAYMSRTLGCRGLRVVAVPNTIHKDKGRFGAVMLTMYGPHRTAWINTVRAVSASNDGGRWVFHQFGEPFPFEKVEQYQARRVKDRFTFDMLEDYLHHLGLSPFSEDFYLPQGAPAWLVERRGPTHADHKEFTLAEARKDF